MRPKRSFDRSNDLANRQNTVITSVADVVPVPVMMLFEAIAIKHDDGCG